MRVITIEMHDRAAIEVVGPLGDNWADIAQFVRKVNESARLGWSVAVIETTPPDEAMRNIAFEAIDSLNETLDERAEQLRRP